MHAEGDDGFLGALDAVHAGACAMQSLHGVSGIEGQDGHHEGEEVAEILGEILRDRHEVDGHHPCDLAHVLHAPRMQVAPQSARDRGEEDVVDARIVALPHLLDVIKGNAR